MTAIAANVHPVLRTTLTGIGMVIIVLALLTHLLALDLGAVYEWLGRAFGPVFLAVYLPLVAVAVYSVFRLPGKGGVIWHETGSQAAGGIATLALTFTLLGISLGIESLANRALNPETVQNVIQDLTRHFSTAFLTTIVGLPTANLLRAIIAVRWVALQTPAQTKEVL